LKISHLPVQRCSYLFFALLLLLVTLPLLMGTAAGRVFANVINLSVLLAAVAAIGRTKLSFGIAALLTLPVVGFQIISFAWADPFYLICSWAFGSAFYCMTLILLLRYVLRPEVMNSDKLYGAAAAYLMLGIVWAYWYGIIQFFYPGAFSPRRRAAEPVRSALLQLCRAHHRGIRGYSAGGCRGARTYDARTGGRRALCCYPDRAVAQHVLDRQRRTMTVAVNKVDARAANRTSDV
jgi:hypothetical protein